MTDLERQHLRLLEVIADISMTFYPYKNDDIVADHLIAALGQIAGLAGAAINKFKSEHDISDTE